MRDMGSCKWALKLDPWHQPEQDIQVKSPHPSPSIYQPLKRVGTSKHWKLRQMTFKWNSWRFDSEITIQPETPLDHGTATGPLPLAPDRSQKEPLRGKFERTTHLHHGPTHEEITMNHWGVSQLGEYLYAFFFGWETSYLNHWTMTVCSQEQTNPA